MDPLQQAIDTDPPNAPWRVHARANRLVDSIKALRSATGAGLYETKKAVEAYVAQSAVDLDIRHMAAEIGGDAVQTRVSLENGGQLHILDNGGYYTIVYSKLEHWNMPKQNLQQAIADLAARYAKQKDA